MIYLVLMLLVGAAGIARLLIAHRRKQTELQTIEGFRMGMEAISQPSRFERRRRIVAAPRDAGDVRRPPRGLDPDRREAAKRRIEARRAERLSQTSYR